MVLWESCCSALLKYGQGAQEQHRWCPSYQSPIGHWGAHEKKVELSHIHLSKELVIDMLLQVNCSHQD